MYLNANEEPAKIKVAVHFSGLADAQATPKIYKGHYFNECLVKTFTCIKCRR